MTKRALCAVAGILSLCLPLAAEQRGIAEGPDGIALSRPFGGFPALTLSDSQLFFFSAAFGRLEPWASDYLPSFNPTEPRRVRPAAMSDGEYSYDGPMVARPGLIYTGGEVGFLYGKSTGKYGGDFFQGYIVGEVGNEHFRLTVGAAYGESTVRGPRWGR